MAKFRFEDLQIWNMGIDVADRLMDISDGLTEKRLYRFAEQLRGAAISIPSNIAEGSGSSHAREFCQFLNIARRSAFECASIIVILSRRSLVADTERDDLLESLDHLSRSIVSFSSTLKP